MTKFLHEVSRERAVRRRKETNMKQKITTIKELPDSERPYEKFLKYGAAALSDAELLAVIIKSGTNGMRSVEVAQHFLNTGKRNLLNLYDISYEEMTKIHGIGKVKAIQLKCVAELSKRITETKYYNKIRLNCPVTIADYYMERLRHERREHLILCMFDSKCHLIGDKLLSVGSIDSSIVSPREIFRAALNCNAVHLILVHNHPSGVPEPSDTDNVVTERISQCGRIMGIQLSDHIIIGDKSYYSYREKNRIVV